MKSENTDSRRVAPDHRLQLLIVDDHPALRAGLCSLLSTEPDFAVAGEAASGERAYAWYQAHRPDVVVMDLSMEGIGGMESLRRIHRHDPDARVVIYSVHATAVMLNRALSMGALGYITKASDASVLVAGIREVANRRGFVSPDLIPVVVQRHASRERSVIEQLTDKEFQIFVLTMGGNPVDDCARILSMSGKTVRNHLTKIKAKLGVDDTAGLVLLAARAGLVDS